METPPSLHLIPKFRPYVVFFGLKTWQIGGSWSLNFSMKVVVFDQVRALKFDMLDTYSLTLDLIRIDEYCIVMLKKVKLLPSRLSWIGIHHFGW